jgi:hypothetical protein
MFKYARYLRDEPEDVTDRYEKDWFTLEELVSQCAYWEVPMDKGSKIAFLDLLMYWNNNTDAWAYVPLAAEDVTLAGSQACMPEVI